ncbi:MAG: 23S rRNA (guanosine(2251)-2'-O)-methyltransferase RlmB [Deltaproteobacteria bacterium]|nr:MAG: 23S rRNA (guanosine(2251)-2'-O)-methyltransferase RlmB [Deltaproteobacteria bacterium]
MPYLIPGYHAVRETLHRRGIPVREVWIAQGVKSRRCREIEDLAKNLGIPVRTRGGRELGGHLPGVVHQGIMAVAERYAYADLEETIRAARKEPGSGLLVAADHLTDEGNLGAVIRTAAFFRAHGFIIPRDRSASVTPRVMKRSAGAAALIPVVRVVNLGRALDRLEKEGFWVIGAAGEGTQSVYRTDWDRDVVLVVGNEQEGLSPGVRKRCRELVSIPVRGPVASLNVAVAAGAVLSEITRRRVHSGPDSRPSGQPEAVGRGKV